MQLTALEFKPLLGLPDGGGTHDSLEDEFTASNLRRECLEIEQHISLALSTN
jgi:hypothetical protein